MKSAIHNQSKSIASSIAAGVLAFAAASNAGAASAAETQDPLTKKVYYGDLNLDSQKGARALYARLRFAAQQVCVPFESIELSRQTAWKSCVDNALESAVMKINKPLVSALHNQSVSRSSNNKS